jgi:hypothetical protein
MAMPLTRPEQYVEEGITRRKLAIVARCGGCPVCTHRLTNWGGCEADRRYPLCMKTPGTQFEPDHEAIAKWGKS